jgi:hypothetical protein
MNEPFDWGSVWSAGGVATALGAIAYPLWKKFLAQQSNETGKVLGESSWIVRQASDLDANRAMVMELIKARAADAEIISSLRLEKALAIERYERMQARLKRMEDALVEIRPEFAIWIRDDYRADPPPFGIKPP